MRSIDYLIEQVNESTYLPPVHKEVLRERINREPTRAKLDEARARLIERHGGYEGWS